MKTVAIIPARGGSKRIPGKNIRLFAGLPMIAYAIRIARAAAVFDRIVVSTESDAVMALARQYGAEVPFRRPVELADDFASTDAVVVHALESLAARECRPQYFCCIYPTVPMLRREYILRGFELLKAYEATTAVAVTSFPYNIFRALRVDDSGRVKMFWPKNVTKRTQDLPEAVHDAGQFYWGEVEKYLRERRLFSRDCVPVPIPRHLVQDIDTPEDWEVAARLYAELEAARE